MTDKLKPGTKAWQDRQDIWRHNSYHDHAVMMIANCNSIIESKTTVKESKQLAHEICLLAAKLKLSLKERR